MTVLKGDGGDISPGSDQPALRKILDVLGIRSSETSQYLPFSQENDRVMFLPDIAYEDANGMIRAKIQAWVYGNERRRGLTHMFALLLGVDIAKLREDEKRRLYERTQFFRVKCKRSRRVLLRHANGQQYVLEKTARNGRTTGVFEIPLAQRDKHQIIDFALADAPSDNIVAKAHFSPKTGLSVISDIDDTIKETAVNDKRQLLINTFLREFVATEGMSAWYQWIKNQTNAAFHYVSLSPIQLYPMLRDFIDCTGFPSGTMHLGETTRWSDIIHNASTTIQHKYATIQQIITAYPKRRFILIGDSNQSDAVIYANLFRRNESQIQCILIRKLNKNGSSKNYDDIFSGIPSKRWLVSSSIDELQHFSAEFINCDS